MGNRKLLLLWGGLGAVVLFALVFLVFLRPGPEQAEVVVAPNRGAVSEQGEEGIEVEPIPEDPGEDTRGRVTGTSQRDPFQPVVQPTQAADENSSSANPSSQKSSSNPSGANSRDSQKQTSKTKTSGSDTNDAKKPSGSGSNDAKPKADEPKNKAPVPIGAGKKADSDSDRTELSVVQVRDSLAVVRINNLRTTLYMSVPDPSGVTFVSSLGGGCGWFTLDGVEDRLSICEGQTRQM
jgi:hypothetical protein